MYYDLYLLHIFIQISWWLLQNFLNANIKSRYFTYLQIHQLYFNYVCLFKALFNNILILCHINQQDDKHMPIDYKLSLSFLNLNSILIEIHNIFKKIKLIIHIPLENKYLYLKIKLIFLKLIFFIYLSLNKRLQY